MRDDLSSLLEEERALILAGRWRELAEVGARKAAGLRALTDASPALLASLRRNGALLAAAAEGFREGARRGAMLRAARAGFRTYDASGARPPAPRPSVERKA